jgi:hypothetical protein
MLQPVPVPRIFVGPSTDFDKAVLRRPPVMRAVTALTKDDANIPQAWKPGSAREGSFRVLLIHLGSAQRLIFAFQAHHGQLCLGLTNFSSGCIGSLPIGLPITVTAGDPDIAGGGEGPVAWGYARDTVRAVDVVIRRVVIPAKLGNNAYFFQAPNGSFDTSDITEVRARLIDGTIYHDRVTVPRLPDSRRSDRTSGRGVRFVP